MLINIFDMLAIFWFLCTKSWALDSFVKKINTKSRQSTLYNTSVYEFILHAQKG